MNLNRVFKVRQALVSAATYYAGVMLVNDDFFALVEAWHVVLKKRVSLPVLTESLRQVLGRTLTRPQLFRLAWLLAGNLDRLEKGEPVLPWACQPEPEWCPIEIIEAHRFRSQNGQSMARFLCRFLAGRPCPSAVQKVWPIRWVFYLAQLIGFPAPWKELHLDDVTELVRCRMLVEVDPARSRNGPVFDKVAENCPPSLKKWNQALMHFRHRIGSECPQGWDHSCHLCPLGYQSCMGGTHPRDYVFRLCVKCGEEQAHDPGALSGFCLRCDS